MTREEVERQLLAEVEACRQRYELAREAYRLHREISADAIGTADGALAGLRAYEAAGEFRAVIDAYQSSLKNFSDFIVKGRLPAGQPPG